MTLRPLARALGLYGIALIALCAAIHRGATLRPQSGEIIGSVWRHGELVERAVWPASNPRDPRLDRALEAPGGTLVYERVTAESSLFARPELLFALSLVPGRDGVRASLGGRTAYVTPDELLARQGYDKGYAIAGLSLSIGADVQLVLALLAERLNTTASALLETATFRRIRVDRTIVATSPIQPTNAPDPPRPPPTNSPTADTLTPADVRGAALDAARYLARGLKADGRFRYFVNAPTNRDLGGYDWPRHAGATYFLAQAATASGDPGLKTAALRAAELLRDGALAHCGDAPCIGTTDIVDLGASSLALIAIAQIVHGGIDDSYRPLVAGLARFLRSQQRPDGEFMHEFDRVHGAPRDVQYLYFSGEATLALSRAAEITRDPEDLRAAVRGLAYLVGPAWSFFGDAYYFGEEHWTCQAMDDLWDRAPDRRALDFCLRWQAQNRRMQFQEGDTPYDADGAFGVTPLITPRLTPVGSRSEAAVATLDAARKAGVPKPELDAIDRQLRHAFALLIRHQFRPGAAHLLADPAAVYGAMPGSAVDWQLRIDYAQHAGSAWLRWLDVVGQ